MPPLQYVILRHEAIAEPHFDLMFETRPGSDLATFRGPLWPIDSTTALTRLKDHRRVYLEFEGELSQRRGRVVRIARGECNIEIGENAVWTIHLLNGCPARQIVVKQIEAEKWEGRPSA